MPDLFGHRLKISDSGWVEPKDIKKTTISRVLALAKVEPLQEPQKHWRCTMDRAVV
jgi:hypothetical protein